MIIGRMAKSVALISLLVIGCDDGVEETYPVEPVIEFIKIAFDEGVDGSDRDELSVTFSITDGDLDFGLDVSNRLHSEFPYQREFYYLKATGMAIPSDQFARGEISVDHLITYDDRQIPPYDSLPSWDECRCCYVYIDNVFPGYLYATANENHVNLIVDFFAEDLNGNFAKIDFLGCSDFSGRTPSISSLPTNKLIDDGGGFKIKMKSARSGQISYSMRSQGFNTWFGSKKGKVRISVKDRALHTSNTIESNEFFLKDI